MVRITHRYDALGVCRIERPFTTEQERTYRLDRFAPAFAEIYPRTVLRSSIFQDSALYSGAESQIGRGKDR